MKGGKSLLLVDAIVNFFLGLVLLAYSPPIISFFGLPETEQYFYPNILGAVLFGIGIALLLEYKRQNELVGLGLGGAISINLAGGLVLLCWLVFGNLNLPFHGLFILWSLFAILVSISTVELIIYLSSRK